MRYAVRCLFVLCCGCDLDSRRERWTSQFLSGLRGKFSVVSQMLLSDAVAVGLCVRCAVVLEHANLRRHEVTEVRSFWLFMGCVRQGRYLQMFGIGKVSVVPHMCCFVCYVVLCTLLNDKLYCIWKDCNWF